MANIESDVKNVLSPYQKRYLAVIIPIVISIMSLISYLRYLNFYTSNWDLGIEMQMLGDNFRGYILFEAGDFETYGVLSHLEIHSTYIALLFSLAYQNLSEPVFLFICQALFFSLALIPLNAISRYYELSDRQSLIVSILYVTNVGFIASQMYDFHWMSLIPLEFLTMFFLLIRKKYTFSLIILVIGSLTLEVFPLLALGLLLFLYYEDILHEGKTNKYQLTRTRLLLISMAITSIVIFLIIKEIQYEILPALLHNTYAISILRDNYPESLFPTSFSIYSTGSSLLYWGILYSSLGFIPFFDRRHLLIALPWLYESILVVPQYATIQDQYSFIALPALFIGLILSIGKGNRENLKFARMVRAAFYIIMTCLSAVIVYDFTRNYSSPARITLSVSAAIIMLTAVLVLTKLPLMRQFMRKQRKTIAYALTVVFVLMIVFNFLVGPLNPVNEEKTVDSGYAFSYSLNPEYRSMIKMVSMIPENASVISSDNLFPYIADDANAFSFYWDTPENLTFTSYYNLSSNFPFKYVLIDKDQMAYIPAEDMNKIHSHYGLLSALYTNQTYPGDIFLYEKNYTGNVISYYVS